MSVINFATAEIGALLTVPMCLMARPIKRDFNVRSTKAYARGALNLVLLHIGFPMAAFFLIKGAFEGFDNISIGESGTGWSPLGCGTVPHTYTYVWHIFLAGFYAFYSLSSSSNALQE
ncbi:hypothetical protein POM88_049708 [Heracleum sosnowskyi]|uniref:Uncharacterized protein n=1 Tax=Heracleum sosnowskyi TaxID=360622 RepID=A0AAD8GW65_9APIA|nr:hypothetical protein POM88_049708 [Heracleum sosnowskyi]